jgi:peptide chain release factor subunit 1
MIEESIDDYYKNVASATNDIYAREGKKIIGIVVGGPGPTKDNFVKSNNLNYQIKVLGVFETGYTDEHTGINELMSKAKELLSEQASMKERTTMERFMGEIARNGLATYGYEKVKAALDADNVAKLIVSEDAELTVVKYRCSNCAHETTKIESGNMRQQKHECGGSMQILSEKDAVGELIQKATDKGVEIAFITTDNQYGQQLLMGFHGVAAMLRYKK